jgi:hypothetical protein
MLRGFVDIIKTLFKKQHLLLVLALMLLLAGAGLVLMTTSLLPWKIALAGMVAVILGVIINMVTFWRKARTGWFFVGFMLVLCGIFFLLINLASPNMGFHRLWPFCMIFSGFSILPVGYFKNNRMRLSYFVPSMCIVFLGGFFLLFSLKIVALPFRVFIYRLWPLILLAIGLVLLVLYIVNRIKFPVDSDDQK